MKKRFTIQYQVVNDKLYLEMIQKLTIQNLKALKIKTTQMLEEQKQKLKQKRKEKMLYIIKNVPYAENK